MTSLIQRDITQAQRCELMFYWFNRSRSYFFRL